MRRSGCKPADPMSASYAASAFSVAKSAGIRQSYSFFRGNNHSL
jgi:hypothetical protein